MTNAVPTIYKGLAGVVVDTTAISRSSRDQLADLPRYAVQDLAANCTFEQVAYLLWNGELPLGRQLELFCQRERASRRADRSLPLLVAKMPDNCHTMDVVAHRDQLPRRGRPEEADSSRRPTARRLFA